MAVVELNTALPKNTPASRALCHALSYLETTFTFYRQLMIQKHPTSGWKNVDLSKSGL
jgi:hypothetical protein